MNHPPRRSILISSATLRRRYLEHLRTLPRPSPSPSTMTTTTTTRRFRHSDVDATSTRPPLPVRVCLVSATTALATPAFPVLGFLYLACRVALPDEQLRRAMEGRWGALLSFASWTLLPNLYGGTVAALILPCAIGNAIVAGTVYGAADVACGGPDGGGAEAPGWAMRTPYVLGSGTGAIVGYVAPRYLYGPLAEGMYGAEGMSSSMGILMAMPYVAEVCVITGAVAGMLLHPLLYYPIRGVPGWHWGYLSGTALSAVVASSFYVYRGREDARLPAPAGSFVEPSRREIVDSILRYDRVSGEVRTYSLYRQGFVGPADKCTEGRRIAEACRSYSAKSGKAVFDDRVLAFVYNYWDVDTKARYPERIVNIKTEEDLQLTQNSAASTDASVAFILRNERFDVNRTSTGSDSANDGGGGGDGTAKVLAVIDDLNSLSKGRKTYRVRQFEDVSTAVELLMIMKQSNMSESKEVSVDILERFVLKSFPELILYSADEQYRGISVESQLRIANWRSPGLNYAIDKWKSVQERETRRIWTTRSLFVVSGILLSIAGSVLHSNA